MKEHSSESSHLHSQSLPHSTDQLMELVYNELRKIAAHRMQMENPGQTLQVTALVHEAYLRLKGSIELIDDSKRTDGKSPSTRWDSQAHFFAAAAEAMRRILVDRARHKKSKKRGGGLVRIELNDPVQLNDNSSLEEFLALDIALEKLETVYPRKAQLVKLRYFAGLTISEAAAALEIATSTADADWAFAKSWLRLEISRLGD